MKTYKSLMLGLSALLMSSCHPTLFEDIDKAGIQAVNSENVSVNGNIINIKKGTPITFNLIGNPDNITFYSGEPGHQFVYREKGCYNENEVDSVKLSFDLWSNYGKYDLGVKGRLKVKYALGDDEATAFPGLKKDNFAEDSVLVESFAWKPLTDDEALITAKTHTKKGMAGNFEKKIPAEWWNKKFTMAFVRNPQKQKIGETYVNDKTEEEEKALESSFFVEDMKVTVWLKDGSSHVSYASSFGFTPLNMTHSVEFEDLKGKQFDLPADKEYGSTQKDIAGYCNMSAVGNGNFNIRGTAVNEKWRYTWLVSDYINFMNRPERDFGVKIKEISQAAANYTYSYTNVGIYKATFLIANTNFDDEQAKVQEFVINVVE